MPVRLDALQRGHRPRVREILDATAVFRREEMDVALALFDEAVPAHGPQPAEYEFVGAFAGDRLLGYACYGPTPATERTYDLYWIAVHPGEQGHGGGTALLREVERRLRDRGARLLVVETSSRAVYTPTRRFYETRGYAEAARVRAFYAPGDDRVVYSKRLTEPPRPVAGRR